MINFSKVGLIQDLVDAVNALPEETSSADKDLVALAKQVATAQVKALKTNGAHLNLRANTINQWRQLECQVAGQTIAVKPVAPVAPATPTALPVQAPTAGATPTA